MLEVDPRSLQVRDGLRGVKPLTDKDRASIRQDIDEKVLRGQPIRFQSSAVEQADNRLGIRGELTIAGATRPASFDLDLSQDGRVSGTLPVTQSEWGIKPFRAFMGALKVRDTVEVVLDIGLADAVADVYAQVAVLSRVTSIFEDQGVELICVHYTAASAALRWYQVIIPRDAVSALEPFDLESSLRQAAFLFAGKITAADGLEVQVRAASR